jgi:hypothetical protein
MSSIDDALELGPERPPFAVLGGQADKDVDITRIERVEEADQLHVLLRHRLLP